MSNDAKHSTRYKHNRHFEMIEVLATDLQKVKNLENNLVHRVSFRSTGGANTRVVLA